MAIKPCNIGYPTRTYQASSILDESAQICSFSYRLKAVPSCMRAAAGAPPAAEDPACAAPSGALSLALTLSLPLPLTLPPSPAPLLPPAAPPHPPGHAHQALAAAWIWRNAACSGRVLGRSEPIDDRPQPRGPAGDIALALCGEGL